MIRVVVTHPDGRIGARTLERAAQVPFAIGAIVDRWDAITRFRVRLIEVEADELPADAATEARAHEIARRLVAKAGQKLIAFGTED
jgi:hypothetical protein